MDTSDDSESATGVPRPGLPDELQAVVAAWPRLPEAVKAGIMEMVGAAGT